MNKKYTISLLLLIVLSILILLCDYSYTIPFEAGTWESSYDLREPMLDNLLSQHIRLGMHRDSIEQLLGPPDGEMIKNNFIVNDCSSDAEFTNLSPNILNVLATSKANFFYCGNYYLRISYELKEYTNSFVLFFNDKHILIAYCMASSTPIPW